MQSHDQLDRLTFKQIIDARADHRQGGRGRKPDKLARLLAAFWRGEFEHCRLELPLDNGDVAICRAWIFAVLTKTHPSLPKSVRSPTPGVAGIRKAFDDLADMKADDWDCGFLKTYFLPISIPHDAYLAWITCKSKERPARRGRRSPETTIRDEYRNNRKMYDEKTTDVEIATKLHAWYLRQNRQNEPDVSIKTITKYLRKERCESQTAI
jgi:hypothetical protein